MRQFTSSASLPFFLSLLLSACGGGGGGSGSGPAQKATHFSVTAPRGVVAGVAFTVTVKALDSANKVATNYRDLVFIAGTDPMMIHPPAAPLTRGIGTFTVTLRTAAVETVIAEDFELTITGTSGPIQVSAAPLTFGATGGMSTTREVHTETLLNDGQVLVVGGMHWAVTPFCEARCSPVLSALASAELYDPASGVFTPTGALSVPRVYHTATLLGDGKVLVTGGDDRNNTKYASTELFDPATGMFSPTGSMATARSGHTATLLNNGKVLVTGGGAAGDTSAELYDPATGTFSPTGNMTASRFFHTATLVTDGRVLLAGGVGPGGSIATAEIYDPATGTFAPTGDMSVARSSHTATLLIDGRVLITGGSAQGVVVPEELFDATTGMFTPTGTMLSQRYLHTATRLADGKVLVTGGISGNLFLSSAELFDPATGQFTAAGNMGAARSEHRAVLLTTGMVLITGGFNMNGPAGALSLRSAELFH